MCIVLGQVKSINQTKIFVGPNQDKTKQLTAYRNTVDSHEENMMILPVPHPETLQLHKVRYKNFFTDLRSSVASIVIPTYSYRMPVERSMSLCSYAPLEVLDYGSYLVSIAPTLEDLFRLDTSVFELPPNIVDFFANHYSREFGYLCCKLKEGKTNYEPVFYSHALHSSNKLFVPTLHYHNHGGHIKTDEADWDHLIYSVGTTAAANYSYRSKTENEVTWKKLPEDFRWSTNDLVRCAEIEGNHRNHDIAFELA